MPRLLKRLLLCLVLPLGLLGAALALGVWLALRQFTPENVTHQLEALCNARVQLDACTLQFFPAPARLELTGLQFHPRDSEADAATPTATRPPIKITNTYLRFRRGVLEMDLLALLLHRDLRVKKLLIETGDVKGDLLPDGGHSLQALFSTPPAVKGRSNPALLVLAPVVAAARAATGKSPPPSAPAPEAAGAPRPAKSPAFKAGDLPGIISVDQITVFDSRIRLRNRKSRATTEITKLNFEIKNLVIDPDSLDTAPPAAIILNSQVLITGGKKNPGPLASLGLRVEGTLTPVEPGTGHLNPSAEFTTLLEQGSTLESIPAMEKIEKNLSRARRAGLKIDPLARQAMLGADTALLFRLQDGRLALAQSAALDFGSYSLAVEAGSELNLSEETHQVRAAWIASQTVSDQALGGADEFLATLGPEAGAELRAFLIDPLVQDGRLRMDFTTAGELADPEIRIAHPLQEWGDQLKEAGRNLLDRIKD